MRCKVVRPRGPVITVAGLRPFAESSTFCPVDRLLVD